jgi:hypothetical protein
MHQHYEHYAKVEIKGRIQTGKIAPGGETTGVRIHAGELSWDLDFGTNTRLRQLAERLNGQTALVTGTFKRVIGTETGPRDVVVVESLSAPDQLRGQ